ncbi:FTR1 family iron permease [Shimazuella kribbensis]|uniref:FTR1 family iron permease n=1 Tax=Shimazuella kribbensis TaxID=139808 RepID=UPI00042708E5|nr:FTR1 family protein [Shimazuella kribbensis]
MIGNKIGKLLLVWICMLCVSIFLSPMAMYAASTDQLLILMGDALAKAGTKNWAVVQSDLNSYKQEWDAQKNQASEEIRVEIDQAWLEANHAMETASTNPNKAFQSISRLAKATDKYITSAQQTIKKSGKEEAKVLLSSMQKCLDYASKNQMARAKICNQQFMNEWAKNEMLIRNDSSTIYGQAETKMSLVRVYVQAEPVNQAKLIQSMQELIRILQEYINGSVQTVSTSKDTLPSVIQHLKKANQYISSGQPTQAADQLQLFIQKWPNVEGVVQVKSPELYTQIENQMAQASSYLLSNPPQTEKADQLIQMMIASLQNIPGSSNYTAWDAGIVLLREGLEAVCVLAALLAFLKHSNNQEKRKWVWSGAITGVLLSIGIAYGLHVFLTTISAGSTRELIEGITGIVAVIMMITVGAWLHAQSNLKNWNKYVGQKMGSALATGSLWSLFAVSSLSVLREGAETLIFYMGMAPSIETDQFILGIVVSAVILIIIGFVVVVMGTKLPLRPFFIIAAAFIYYLTIKFMGQSIHSLQVADKISSHLVEWIPTINWLGIYPTWESILGQLFVVLITIVLVIVNKIKNNTSNLMVSSETK